MTVEQYKTYELDINDIKEILAKHFKVEEDDVDLRISEYSNDFGEHSVDLFCEVKVKED